MRLDNMSNASVAGFSFSAIRTEKLGASEYTLVTLVMDKTRSVEDFSQKLFDVKKRVVEACRKSPRSDFILLRVIEFNTSIDEVHGFVPLAQIETDLYIAPKCSGLTALYEAVFSAVGVTNAYAKQLATQDYLVNALVVIVTDGDNNVQGVSVNDVQEQIISAAKEEYLESIKTILVAVNAKECEPKLRAFAADAKITEYVDIGDASAAKLARLADFVSQSISATSQALGTNGPSVAITF